MAGSRSPCSTSAGTWTLSVLAGRVGRRGTPRICSDAGASWSACGGSGRSGRHRNRRCPRRACDSRRRSSSRPSSSSSLGKGLSYKLSPRPLGRQSPSGEAWRLNAGISAYVIRHWPGFPSVVLRIVRSDSSATSRVSNTTQRSDMDNAPLDGISADRSLPDYRWVEQLRVQRPA